MHKSIYMHAFYVCACALHTIKRKGNHPTYACMYVCVCNNMYVYMYLYVRKYIDVKEIIQRMYIYVCKYMCAHVRMYVCAIIVGWPLRVPTMEELYIYIYIYICIYIYTYIYIYIYIHNYCFDHYRLASARPNSMGELYIIYVCIHYE